jgi:transcriptional regulator with XRE-family HTH domain
MEHHCSNVHDTLSAIMFGLQRAQNRRITYADMASTLGVSHRAFSEWMRGAREPAAMEALLKMLSMLPSDEVLRVLDVWRDGDASKHSAISPSIDKKIVPSSKSRKSTNSKIQRKN